MFITNKMLVRLNFVVFFIVLVVQGSLAAPTTAEVAASGGFRNCSINNIPGCPNNSACTPQGNNSTALCICMAGFNFNKDYKNDTDYCVQAPNSSAVATDVKAVNVTSTTTTTTVAAPVEKTTTTVSTTIKPTVMVPSQKQPVPAPTSNSGEVHQSLIYPKAESHHFFAGIMLPLLVVFAFIGSVYAVRKYDLIERARDYVHERTARHRANYGNDFDEFDDPLLI